MLKRETLGDAVEYLTAEPDHQRQLPRRQGGRHRASRRRRDDGDGDRARHQVGDRVVGHQAGQDGDRPRRAGASVHQRGREDPRGYGRRRLHEPRVTHRIEAGHGLPLCMACVASLCELELMVCHYLVKGRVQGVGFRWFVQREAAELGLRGWVRNTDEGHVEIVAAGEPEELAELKVALRQGFARQPRRCSHGTRTGRERRREARTI